ncbi:ABC transporter ATP-binding protein [Shimia sp. SDUM112013]|uniref:ABC transporter ATP-binding protein n=1 Tax=Shimia sp. SDUM112013 TaxID=3136160 RepID=UPI0032EF66C1
MTETVLDIRNLSKAYGALEANKDISLDLRGGEIHGLIGPNGAGKSTFIKQVSGAEHPDHGSVALNGVDITAQDAVARARMGLARTFQISSLAMDYTVLQNVLLGAVGRRGRVMRFFSAILKDTAQRDMAMQALQRVGLADEAHVQTAALSHGQRRQLEVAVALTLEPKVFLMDEPMAGLGAEGSQRLIRVLDGLRHEAPILLVEHDMDAVFALADRISVLVYGQIIATGTPDEIRQNADVRTAYLGDDAA